MEYLNVCANYGKLKSCIVLNLLLLLKPTGYVIHQQV
jgi:hypothetical protein